MLDERSRHLRQRVIDTVEGGGRGHIGSAMSLIEILRVLYDDVMDFRVTDPLWTNRDRLILSKGHGCIALYVMLADKGFISLNDLQTFCKFDSRLGGHPEHGQLPGVEASTGALGHGLAVGVGMAYAARLRGATHRIFVILGDGELDEGSVWESALAASHHNLENLIVIVDFNKLQSFGPVESVWRLEPLRKKWESFGFETLEVHGHDIQALRGALVGKLQNGPRAVIAHTVKGRGIDFAEHNPDFHHKSSVSTGEIRDMREAVDRA